MFLRRGGTACALRDHANGNWTCCCPQLEVWLGELAGMVSKGDILVVEDDLSVLETPEAMLDREGYAVATATHCPNSKARVTTSCAIASTRRASHSWAATCLMARVIL